MPGAGAPARPTTPAFSNPGSGIGRGTRPTQAIANECMSGAEHGRHRADAISTCFVPSTVRPVFQEEREKREEREREKRIRKKKEKRDLSEINYYLSLLPSFLSTFSTTTSFTRTSHVYLLFLLFHLSPLGVGRNFISTRDYFTYVEAETEEGAHFSLLPPSSSSDFQPLLPPFDFTYACLYSSSVKVRSSPATRT